MIVADAKSRFWKKEKAAPEQLLLLLLLVCPKRDLGWDNLATIILTPRYRLGGSFSPHAKVRAVSKLGSRLRSVVFRNEPFEDGGVSRVRLR
jgi:hypothetical protein